MAGETSILAQSNPSASTLTDILTVGAAAVRVGEIFICNQGTTTAAVRLSVAPAGAADTAAQYLLYGTLVGPGRTLCMAFPPSGLTLNGGTIVRGYSDSASVSFNIRGT